MNATFLVSLNIGSDTDLLGIAQDIEAELSDAGMDVLSCAPWSHPSLSGVPPSTALGGTQPQIQQTPQIQQ
jgi:hypothetical protein